MTGFPWNLIAYSFSSHLEILNITSVIGTYGFNLFCISLFISPAVFILRDTRFDIWVCIFFLLITIIFYLYGSQSKKVFTEAEINSIDHKVRVIGSNIKLDRFYSNIDPTKAIEDLIELSEPGKNEKNKKIYNKIIKPKILFPYLENTVGLIFLNWLKSI